MLLRGWYSTGSIKNWSKIRISKVLGSFSNSDFTVYSKTLTVNLTCAKVYFIGVDNITNTVNKACGPISSRCQCSHPAYLFSYKQMTTVQCDQIGRFIGLWASF